MTSIVTKSMTVADIIKKLQNLDPNDLMVGDLWMVGDIKNVSEELENLTDDQCRIVMAFIEENYSTEAGINNEVILSAVDDCIAQKLIDFCY